MCRGAWYLVKENISWLEKDIVELETGVAVWKGVC
jgi:hypothetical protein